MGVSSAGKFASINSKSQLDTPTYDTWSDHYEFNGIDEDGDSVTDQKNNMIDDNPPNGIIDDEDELETSPPLSSSATRS